VVIGVPKTSPPRSVPRAASSHGAWTNWLASTAPANVAASPAARAGEQVGEPERPERPGRGEVVGRRSAPALPPTRRSLPSELDPVADNHTGVRDEPVAARRSSKKWFLESESSGTADPTVAAVCDWSKPWVVGGHADNTGLALQKKPPRSGVVESLFIRLSRKSMGARPGTGRRPGSGGRPRDVECGEEDAHRPRRHPGQRSGPPGGGQLVQAVLDPAQRLPELVRQLPAHQGRQVVGLVGPPAPVRAFTASRGARRAGPGCRPSPPRRPARRSRRRPRPRPPPGRRPRSAPRP
jgi:hypothetical protein